MKEFKKIDLANKEINLIDYPNPSKIREKIRMLNGLWDFSFDGKIWKKIKVPFCPESKLSGIQYTSFINKCYYKKRFRYVKNDNRLILHFGAVDYLTSVFINGNFVGEHRGGYTSFEFDITDYIVSGNNEIYLSIIDNLENICSGKQSKKEQSFGCFYTRITGIWQNVWIEERNVDYIQNFYFYPNIEDGSVNISLVSSTKGNCRIEIFYKGEIVGEKIFEIDCFANVKISLKEKHLWDVYSSNIYYVKINFRNDVVFGYFGLREASYIGNKFFLNKRSIYQKMVLHQGYYEDGICTPANVAVMRKDILSAKRLGFNGIRLHQKVFDPRFLYLCDIIGMMVWGEFASWGIDYFSLNNLEQFLIEWKEVVNRDFNHPSIITWCPLNEVWSCKEKVRDINFIEKVYFFTKQLDSTRPCVDVSGGHHCEYTDLFDFHSYELPSELSKYLNILDKEKVLDVQLLYDERENIKYDGNKAVNLSECGGFALVDKKSRSVVKTVNNDAVLAEDDWGYGEQETNANVFISRYKELIETIYSNKTISGFCYTQLFDIEQEKNGFFYYNRKSKLTKKQIEKIREINSLR